MAASQGFWSYVHADDQADAERISRLAKDVTAQFEMLTGEPLELFLDKDAIRWGEDWRDKIDSSLASVAFFIPVLTPRYFMSAECRRELQFFARRATRLGIKELVLPLLYVDVPAIHDESSADDLVVLTRTFQWEDWRELRFFESGSEAYRRGVSRLAGRLVESNRQLERAHAAAGALQISPPLPEAADDSPGFIDQVATAEETFPEWTKTIEAIGRDIELIGQVMQEATADIHKSDAQTKGFGARLLIARRVARHLAEPAERIWSSGNEFASQLHSVDEGVRAIIERAPAEAMGNEESRVALCAFFDAVRFLAVNAHTGLDAAQGMIDALAPIEKMSRDLRPVLRRLRQGLTTMVEAREVTDEWVRLIDMAGLSCGDSKVSAGS